MAIEDKIKWDKKYQNTPELLKERRASKKLVDILDKTNGKKALEIACGSGRNSIFLAKQGFNVDALDISKVALDTLNSKVFLNISTQCIDLENYTPPENSYNLIVMTNYLNREIIPALSNALKPGGILFIETYMNHPTNTKPNSNPDFLLKAGELKSFFNNKFEILDYEEFDNEAYELYKMKKQSISVLKL